MIQLLRDKGIEFSSREPSIIKDIVPMAGVCVAGAFMFKMTVKKINKPGISPVDLKSSIY